MAPDYDARLHTYLEPIVSGLDDTDTHGPTRAPGNITLAEYVELLEVLYTTPNKARRWSRAQMDRWRSQVMLVGRRQRVYGSANLIKNWLKQRGLRLREIPTTG